MHRLGETLNLKKVFSYFTRNISIGKGIHYITFGKVTDLYGPYAEISWTLPHPMLSHFFSWSITLNIYFPNLHKICIIKMICLDRYFFNETNNSLTRTISSLAGWGIYALLHILFFFHLDLIDIYGKRLVDYNHQRKMKKIPNN